MKIVLIAVGTRGDVEPFLAVGSLLAARGHRITCAFPGQYVPLAEEAGFAAVGLDRRLLELAEGRDGEALMGGGGGSWWRSAHHFMTLAREGLAANRRVVSQLTELLGDDTFDRVVFHPKASFPFVYAVARPDRVVALSPVPWVVHPVPGRPHLGFEWLGRIGMAGLSYRLVNYGLAQNLLGSTREFRKRHGIRAAAVRRAVVATPLAYSVSPSLFPRPERWPDHVRVLGFHPRQSRSAVEDPKVAAFVARHGEFVVVTFGSMRNADPEGKSRMLLTVLAELGIPAILNRAGGGLAEPPDYDRERFLFTATLDYDRVFPLAAAVIHHGGAGTTQTGLLHGRPTLIFPHIVDQFAWNRLVAVSGLGPEGIPISQLSEKTFRPRLLDLLKNRNYRLSAAKLGIRMRAEDYEAAICRFLTGSATPSAAAPRNP